jgi:hypothetical protein
LSAEREDRQEEMREATGEGFHRVWMMPTRTEVPSRGPKSMEDAWRAARWGGGRG